MWIAIVHGRRRRGKSYLLRRLAEATGGPIWLAFMHHALIGGTPADPSDHHDELVREAADRPVLPATLEDLHGLRNVLVD